MSTLIMEQQDKDVARLQELLQKTGEFIAYFELAENKMLEWREYLSSREIHHEKMLEARFEKFQKSIEAMESCFTQAGIARFKLQFNELLAESKLHLEAIEKAERKLLLKTTTLQRSLHEQVEKTSQKIHAQSEQALHAFQLKLNELNLPQATISQELPKKKSLPTWSHPLTHLMGALVIVFGLGFYLTDEAPWEIHQQAKQEKHAGKILNRAWAHLTHAEREKIIAVSQLPPPTQG